jgi:sugar lactone lactonase YvrE
VLLTFAGLGAWLARLAWRKAVVSSTLWDEDDAPAAPDAAAAPAVDESQPVETVALSPIELEAPSADAIDGIVDQNPLVIAGQAEARQRATRADEIVDQNPLVIADSVEAPQTPRRAPASIAAPIEPEEETVSDLWIGFGFYWFFLAFTVFSWAGEKMPWLTIHMTLPAVLTGAWALARLTRRIDWDGVRNRWGWLILPLVGGAVVLLLAASAQISAAAGAEQVAQQSKLGGWMLIFLALLVGGVIWQIGRWLDPGTTLRMVALGFVAMLGLYTVRSSINAAYRQSDVPVEFLVYTQTAPDVPLIVKEIERIAITQNRTTRSVADPTGGHSMKILLSGGDPSSGNSEGSLRQPLEWYLRDWTNVQWRDKTQIAALAEADLDAPIAIFARSNMAPDTQQKLEQAGYVEVYSTYHNWWFPEWSGDGNSTYKELLYDPKYGCDPNLRGQRDVNGRSLYSCTAGGIGILTWPLRPSNWNTLREYMLSRKLPAGTEIGGREMVVFMRREVAPQPGDGNAAVAGSSGTLKLVSEGALSGDQPTEPRGMATGPDGSVYVTDAPSNRILVYQTDGVTRVISGTGAGALLEPSGVAVDSDGNVYVADTWNARIAKFDSSGKFVTSWGSGEEKLNAETNKVLTRTGGTAEGNAAKPLGFFGPRNVAVDNNGHVYIADTGNKRIVVTDDQGLFLGQIGTAGAAPGQFNEPIGLAVDPTNNLIVGDTWNGRVQIFALDSNGLPNPTPTASWVVPGWKADTYLDPFLAVSSEGKIVVAVPERSMASLYDISGRVLLTWGGEGTDEASLNRPSGISFAPDGSVYIAEKGNSRIQRWILPRVR